MPIAMREGKVVPDDIGTRAVGSQHLANDAVGSSRMIADSVILTGHISNDAIGSSKQVADNVIGHDQMMDAAIGYSELTTGLRGSLGGAAGADSIGTTELKEPAVNTDQLYDNAVGSSSKIGADVIMGYHIVDDAIGSEHLEANAVGSSNQVGDNVIGGDQIINNSIGYGELSTGLQGTYMPKSGGTFVGSVDYSGAGKPPRLAVLTPGGAITPTVNGAFGTIIHTSNFSWFELRCAPTGQAHAIWEFQTPEYYDGGTIDLNIFWKGKGATGTVAWQANTLGRTINETWNSAKTAFGTAVSGTYGSAKVNKTTMTGKPDFGADELAMVDIFRYGDSGLDTMAGSVSILMVGIDFKAKK
jgi:hypothetical protein